MMVDVEGIVKHPSSVPHASKLPIYHHYSASPCTTHYLKAFTHVQVSLQTEEKKVGFQLTCTTCDEEPISCLSIDVAKTRVLSINFSDGKTVLSIINSLNHGSHCAL